MDRLYHLYLTYSVLGLEHVLFTSYVTNVNTRRVSEVNKENAVLNLGCVKSCGMDVNLHTVLKSHVHSQALLKVGENYGFSFRRCSGQSGEGHGSIINLGSIPHEDLDVAPSNAPRGYEEKDGGSRTCLIEPISLYFLPSKHFTFGSVARLRGLEVFPRNNKSGIELSFVMDGGDPLNKLEVTLGSEFSFYLQFTMPGTFSGHLKRLILFTFEVSESVQLLVSKTTTLTMGVVILGSIIPRGVDRTLKVSDGKDAQVRVDEGRQKLSVEAKVFAPVAAITHFDTPVRSILFLLVIVVLQFT